MAEAQTQSPASGSDLSGLLMQQLAGQSASSSALQKSLGESAAMKRGVAEKLLAERPPPAPVMSPPPAPAPTPAEHSPLEAFGSLAAGLAILGSFKSRAPFTAALKAGAAAMNGVKQRDAEAFQRNYKIWQQQSQYAAQLEKWQTDRYKMAMDEYSGDQNKMLSVLQVMSAADKDDIAAAAIRTGDIRNLESLIMHRDQMLQQYQMHRDTIEMEGKRIGIEMEKLKSVQEKAAQADELVKTQKSLFEAVQEARKSGDPAKIAEAEQAVKDFNTVYNKSLAPALVKIEADQPKREKTQAEADLLKKKIGLLDDLDAARQSKDPERIKAAEQAIKDYDLANTKSISTLTSEPLDDQSAGYLADIFRRTGKLPPMGYGVSASQNRAKVLSMAAQQSTASGSTGGGDVAGQATFNADKTSLTNLTKMTDSAISFENTALKNMGVVESLAEKGEGTSIGPVVNRWLQAGRVATGDPDVAAFNAAIQTVANEYAKIMSGSTGSMAATEGARTEAQAMISNIFSPAQIEKVFSTMRKDMDNRKSSLAEQRASIQERLKNFGHSSIDTGTGETKTQFENGKIYQDAAGNKARYENGKWVPVQ